MSKKRLILSAAAGALALCCIGALVVGVLMPGTSGAPTRAAGAPAPPGAPAPTDTPVPPAPPFEEIRASHEAMTEAQWKSYRTRIEGTMVIDWHGWIDEVTGNPGSYKVMVDMDSPDDVLSYAEIRFGVPDDIALTLNVGQPVTFSGKIRTAMDMLGALDITLEPAELR